jgi:hypothetical protein
MSNRATYSPEDDKLRLYVGRVPRDEYERLRDTGWTSTPKQDCDFVAIWSPSREDTALSYLEDDEDIEDEDYSPEERAADKAERLDGYREKRAEEAIGQADAFAAGPSAYGHQNENRARRQATRHDRLRGKAVSQWSKAEYWQMRTAGVIQHALHRSSASVRRGRILRLEAEQRKHLEGLANAVKRYNTFKAISQGLLDGSDLPFESHATVNSPLAIKAISVLTNDCYLSGGKFKHPRTGVETDLYDMLRKSEDKVTPREVAVLWMGRAIDPADPETYWQRWSGHYELRLEYERAMLAEEGGSAAEAEMEPGGWICTRNRTGSVFTDVKEGWKQVISVNRSPVTKRVTSVKVWGRTSSRVEERNDKPVLVSVNVERLPEGAYRPPTDEERAAFQEQRKAEKAAAKAAAPKTIPLVNPTEADAQRLQACWNDRARTEYDKKKTRFHDPYVDTPILRMTQAEYSARSKGSYTSCDTRTLDGRAKPSRAQTNIWSSEGDKYDSSLSAPVAKIRCKSGGGWHNPPAVIVLTDKPQSALPLDWDAIEKVEQDEPANAE